MPVRVSRKSSVGFASRLPSHPAHLVWALQVHSFFTLVWVSLLRVVNLDIRDTARGFEIL